MDRLRGKLTYANVLSTLCLVLLVGGGTALAASQMLPKDSVGSRQIKKGAVTPAKLSTAAKSTLTGPAGPQGATGPQGPKGNTGPAGEPGPLVQTLPSGKTERGMYTYAGTRATGGGAYTPADSISYPIPLSATPSVGKVAVGGPSTANCPGSAKEPEAARGFLCLYETRDDGGHPLLVEVTETAQQGFGFALYFEVAEGQNYEYGGRWAVTAP